MLTVRVAARQLFAQMDAPALKQASALLLQLLSETPLTEPAKDASALLEGCALAHPAAAVALFLPALLQGVDTKCPARLMVWRLRLLCGLVKCSGVSLVQQQQSSSSAVLAAARAGLAHSDKGVRKAACKLLRHLLHGLIEVSVTLTFWL
jgi:hypothetical protein